MHFTPLLGFEVVLLLVVMICGNAVYFLMRNSEESKVDDSKTVEVFDFRLFFFIAQSCTKKAVAGKTDRNQDGERSTRSKKTDPGTQMTFCVLLSVYVPCLSPTR